MVYSFAILTIFSVASALAPNFAALVVFRLFVGIGGSCAISVVGGICADVWHDPIKRGRSMAIFMVCLMVEVGREENTRIGVDDCV
jgi:predicted MFS family arabinose efflux permease